MAPVKLIDANSAPTAPIVTFDFKSGTAATTSVSAALPRLIVSEVVGFWKVEVSNGVPLTL
ncbi:MAG TPA: hypothetical protein VN641_07245, partial [Urbifossiella sp.]|nr:hypothetical protein [Urbifossiella sp.]